MASHGIDSVEAVAHASIEQLVAIPGIGASRAAALTAAANRLLSETTVESGAADSKQPDATTGTEDSDASAEITGDPVEPDEPPGRVTRDKKGKKDRKKRKAEKKRKKGKKEKKKNRGAKKLQEKDKGRKKSKKGGK